MLLLSLTKHHGLKVIKADIQQAMAPSALRAADGARKLYLFIPI